MEAFDLRRLVRFNTRVTDLRPLTEPEPCAANGCRTAEAACGIEHMIGPRWSLTREDANNSEVGCLSWLVLCNPGQCMCPVTPHTERYAVQATGRVTEVFDAVIVAVGNYHEPNLVCNYLPLIINKDHRMVGLSSILLWFAAGRGGHAHLPRSADALPQLPACRGLPGQARPRCGRVILRQGPSADPLSCRCAGRLLVEHGSVRWASDVHGCLDCTNEPCCCMHRAGDCAPGR